MVPMANFDPVDYLVIGHITVDLTPSGPVIGGSASYSALTARALGLRVGVVTVRGNEIPLTALDGIAIVEFESGGLCRDFRLWWHSRIDD